MTLRQIKAVTKIQKIINFGNVLVKKTQEILKSIFLA